jgi:hypothetical protein
MFNHKQDIFGLAGVWGFEWRRENIDYKGSGYVFDYDTYTNKRFEHEALDYKRDGFPLL